MNLLVDQKNQFASDCNSINDVMGIIIVVVVVSLQDIQIASTREKGEGERKILKLMSFNRYTAIVPHHKHKKEITEMFMLLFPLLGDL